MTPFPSVSRLCIAAWDGWCDFQPITLSNRNILFEDNSIGRRAGVEPAHAPTHCGRGSRFPCGVPPSMRRHRTLYAATPELPSPSRHVLPPLRRGMSSQTPPRVSVSEPGGRDAPHVKSAITKAVNSLSPNDFSASYFSFFARAVAAWPLLRPVTAAAPGRSGKGCGRRFHLLVALASRRVLLEVRAALRLSTCGVHGVRLAGSAPSFGVAFAARSWDGRYRTALSAPGAFTSWDGVFLTPSSLFSGISLSPTGDRRMPCPF